MPKVHIEAREVERNQTGRIMKVRERELNNSQKTLGFDYVVQTGSRLVGYPARNAAGKFTGEKVFLPEPCPTDVATGWSYFERYPTFSAARAALGINTSPKRANAVAAALKLAA